ncbi:MAG: hypothetical protein K2X81_19240, partial [Candidatus Obscuribacterales bacterium]|nr:hypothetical protein [Candidatus Obscuribacterales bacterium]
KSLDMRHWNDRLGVEKVLQGYHVYISTPFDGIVGLAFAVLIFAACCGVERLVHKGNPHSAKFFWWGNIAGAVVGFLCLVSWVSAQHGFPSLAVLSLLLIPGALTGSIAGGLLGLAIGLLWSYVKKNN